MGRFHFSFVFSQQLANIAIKGSNERRYFTGVEGDKERKGELFGLENLFSYRAEGASLSKDIVKRTQKLEAGYRVTNYEIVHEKKGDESLENEVRDLVRGWTGDGQRVVTEYSKVSGQLRRFPFVYSLALP